MNINEDNLNDLLGRFVGDLGATMHAGSIVIGEKLGLYKAMATPNERVTAEELAGRTGTNERYVREWLNANAAGGYLQYDADADAYYMTDEQAFVMTNENNPAYLPGAFILATAALKSVPKMIERFKTGDGLGWHEHDGDLFCGTELFFRPGYIANLVDNWIPALDGVEEKLKAGAKVADVGCGLGSSTIIMAKAFPNSEFIGFDYHDRSIEAAREKAEAAGVADRVKFDVAPAKNFPGSGYDLVTFFDCLHDMGDPIGAAKHVREAMNQDGTWMIVEPFANDKHEENHNPVGRVYYSASTIICTPASRSQEVGLGLGAQAGEGKIREVVSEGGFSRFRRATETPFNLVLEARP
ncbi:MAG TPA: methyltransferase domain-containing protein [Pyrinomonadaceae bacterium]|nr:methyltransferase domain-containing protein [Pyrinomonadaceae bacterium]